jgi:AcrR family transcriptional regulator
LNAVATSPRGTRPRNRREQIRNAAARLFYERGYEQVSVADVAEAVNIGPSAVYRHFSSKADLLFEAIDQIIDAFARMVADLPARDLDGIARTAARTALAYRPLGVLWQREARYLPAEQQAELRRHLRDAVGTLAGTLREIRPELTEDQAEFLAACGVAAMSSISFHGLSLPEQEFEELLTGLARRVLSYAFPGGAPPVSDGVALPAPANRREEIADVAAGLFARHGYDAVGVDDIGAAVGIAGPSLYNHFASKQDLLLSSLGRGYALLQAALADALESKAPAPEALRRVVASYVDLTHDHNDLVTNLIAESRNLGPDYQDLVQRAQLGYITQWVDLRPVEDATVSRLKVQAAQMLANSVSRTLYLRSRPGFRRDLREVCWLLVA